MKKWGVRLIGISFLFGAMTIYFNTITKQNPPRGLMGFSFYYASGPSPASMTPQLDIVALIGLCANLYVAYNLLRLKNQGRVWALIVLWLSVLLSVVGLVVLSFTNHMSPISA